MTGPSDDSSPHPGPPAGPHPGNADPASATALPYLRDPASSDVTTADKPLRWVEPPTGKDGWGRRVGRYAATALAFAAAVLAGLVVWDYYVVAPWTRDGRIRVQVSNVAPQVSGQITEIRIVDNQFVRKGDVLYVVDQFDYRVRLSSAKATTRQQAADYQVKREQAQRLLALNSLSTTAQAQQAAVGAADMAQASFELAQQQQDQAEINMQRTQVRSPVNGFVTNLLMRVGDFASTGTTNVSIIDTDSYWVDGYFEETKLGRICVGDRAEAQLMGFGPPIIGAVDTITRGISVSNATPSTQGLPSVDAVYTWVRLAQRVPVRIRITDVPPGVPLVSGLTATVTLRRDPSARRSRSPFDVVTDSVRDVFAAPAPASGCIPPTQGGTGPVATIPEPRASPGMTPEQLDPGLTPGLTSRPARP